MTTKNLMNKVILITGAGNGIGKETAIQMADRGAIVGVNDLKAEFVDAVVERIQQTGGRAFAVVQNMSTLEGVQAALQQAYEQENRLDGLVNNAAWVRYQAIPDIQENTMDRMLDIGFKSIVWSIQAAAKYMKNGGAIINISSTAAVRSTLNSVVYSGIKAGVLGITRAAAAELGAQGIRVNAVCPSAIPTEGTERNRNAERDAARIAKTPLARLGHVSDIAKTICFLASDEAEFISAQSIVVDGGVTFTNI